MKSFMFWLTEVLSPSWLDRGASGVEAEEEPWAGWLAQSPVVGCDRA